MLLPYQSTVLSSESVPLPISSLFLLGNYDEIPHCC